MFKAQTYRLMSAFLVGLFLFFQASASVHEMEAEDVSHHDDCVYCLVISEDKDVKIAISVKTSAINFTDRSFLRDYTFIPSMPWIQTPPGRAPPPRGPPFHL